MHKSALPQKPVAWLIALKGLATPTLIWANPPESSLAPFSEVTELIQGIWESYPSVARMILRNRIFISRETPPTAFETGMTKVAAKALSNASPDDFAAKVKELPSECVTFLNRFSSSAPVSQEADWDALHALAQKGVKALNNLPLYSRDRKVAAGLVDLPLGRMICSVNQNHANRTLHAELILVLEKLRDPENLEGNAIWVTLKPCKMCAGLLRDFSELKPSSPFGVTYDREDDGPLSKNTALDGLPWFKKKSLS